MQIHTLLEQFGLSKKEQTVFSILLKHEWCTVLQLSKKCSIKRTTLYRVIDSLLKKGIIEMRVDDKTTYYKASHPSNFESLIIQRQAEVNKMKQTLHTLQQQIHLLSVPHSQTSISFYRGVKGIMNIEWKLVDQPNKEICVFGIDQWWKIVGFEFAEKIRHQSVENNITIREILNTNKIGSSDYDLSWTTNTTYVKNHYQGKYINQSVLPIKNELYITPSAIYIYSLEPNDIVGIEIVNQEYAQLMKQLFEMTWQQATPISVLEKQK